mmetsp:Transcript_77049/g.135903  ORF Transcript_77049/g.135903 Transcript_77049/m.135903 type:complete len:320 (+) Transcript_77049:103-1062(+)|eukprot:CAMPEP_0197657240 /NCGR_PEP_ID=MMETSP1338-20131121/44509_1 /TAXON_ID=43686 ORGANISM="Pelagodinium beii, Strain RCC1491" /NCGR_SAMPLE_ID=MMETSP1338 /ASSEMBLY_ACC=CAM_ASM_000754 /LENGTH=319 /DNA_ID=CAMNT_0043233569 /DNA_START=103 /DNA_END=1062 /DNA_ORIENTATION=+
MTLLRIVSLLVGLAVLAESHELAAEVTASGHLVRSSRKSSARRATVGGDGTVHESRGLTADHENYASHVHLQSDTDSDSDHDAATNSGLDLDAGMNISEFWPNTTGHEKMTISDVIVNFQDDSNRAKAFIAVLVDFVFYMVAVDAFASMKVWPAVREESNPGDLESWSSSLFCSTFDDMTIFWWSLMCPMIQHADSMQMIGKMRFTNGAILFGSLWFGTFAYLPQTLVSLFFFLLLLTFCRQRNRKIFNIQGYGNAGYILADFFIVSCCMPCAISQEARHIKAAAIVGHEAVQVRKPLPQKASTASAESEKQGLQDSLK